ncbi:hypothetical protein KSW81_004596 [Nannochloris sp. 'desiccata']|nr:hypothetical protein KSW81_004596 [Chlorella desiccata (nom. nud.)]
MSNPFLDKTPTSGDDLGPPQYAWNRGNANAFGSPLQPSSISSGLSASSPAIGTPNTPQTQRGGFPSQAASTDEIPLYSSQSTQYATPAASVFTLEMEPIPVSTKPSGGGRLSRLWGGGGSTGGVGTMSTSMNVSAGTPTSASDLHRREAELQRREADLARREASLAAAGAARKNWPKYLKLVHHDINADIPAQRRGLVRAAYFAWCLVATGYIYNFICITAFFIGGQKKVSLWVFSGLVAVAGLPLSFLCWYRGLYWAAARDTGVRWGWAILHLVAHIVCLWGAFYGSFGEKLGYIKKRAGFAGGETAVERFKKFDFDNNAKWKEYLNSLTFPPDLYMKYKAKYQLKWYKREIEPDFDINEVIETSSPSGEKAMPAPSAPTTTSSRKPAPNATPPSSAPSPSNLQSRPGVIDLALLAGHICLFIFCIMAVQPFSPFLSMKGMAQCNKISLPVHAVRLFRKVGAPSGAGGISTWFKSVSRTTESFYIFLISMAASNPAAVIPAVLPVAILSLYHISATLNLLFGNGKSAIWDRSGASKVHRYLAMNQQNALQAMAILEIGTFFSILLSALRKGPLGFFAVYAFAAQLRMRYWSPESRVYHVNGWRRLRETVQPVLSKVGFAQRIVERGERFFDAGRPVTKEQ